MAEGNGKGLRAEVMIALIGLFSAVGVALLQNWEKIFPSSPGVAETQAPVASSVVQTPTPITSPTMETPTPIASPVAETPTPIASSPVGTPDPAKPNEIDTSFVGNWSTEGDVRATHRMDLEITQVGQGKIGGVITAENYGSGSQSGALSIVGDVDGEVANLEIFNQQGLELAEAELKTEADTLVWRLKRVQGTTDVLPGVAYFYKL
ncbi:MAG: hypothetical protein ACRC8A_12180 [Microcoleaceae cyanobacterium]